METQHGLLAVFIEWAEDGHEKFEFIGIYTNDTAKLFTRDAIKVANQLGIKKYGLVTLLSQVNECYASGFEDFKNDVHHIQLESRGEITESEVDKMNESISAMIKDIKHETTEEDAKAILKDAEEL